MAVPADPQWDNTKYKPWLGNWPPGLLLRRSGLPFAEKTDESPQESYQGDEWAVRRCFRVPWRWRHQFILEQLGASWLRPATNSDGKGGFEVQRLTPVAYAGLPRIQPYLQDDGTLATIKDDRPHGTPCIYPYCVEPVTPIKPTGLQNLPSNGRDETDPYLGEYKWCWVPLLYKSVPYDVLPDNDTTVRLNQLVDESTLKRFVSREAQPSAQFLHLPLGAFKWVEDDAAKRKAPLIGANGRAVGFVDYHYTWHCAPAIPTSVRKLLGHVNKFSFDGKKPGLLLYTACQIRRYMGRHGLKQYDLTFRLRHFEVPPKHPTRPANAPDDGRGKGHNWFLRYHNESGELVYQMATHSGVPVDGSPAVPGTPSTPTQPAVLGGRPVYPEADLRDLFRFLNFFDSTDTGESKGQYEHF